MSDIDIKLYELLVAGVLMTYSALQTLFEFGISGSTVFLLLIHSIFLRIQSEYSLSTLFANLRSLQI